MVENPYESPHSELAISSQSRSSRRTPAMFVFVALGLMLIGCGVTGVIAIGQDSKLPLNPAIGITLGAAGLAVLGMSLIVHGVAQTNITINTVVLILAVFVLTALTTSVLIAFL